MLSYDIHLAPDFLTKAIAITINNIYTKVYQNQKKKKSDILYQRNISNWKAFPSVLNFL